MWPECRQPFIFHPLQEVVRNFPQWIIENARKLANVCIHIEHVIGATHQRYAILMSCMPINFLKAKNPGDIPPIDKIILICSALNNLCVSVVPID